MVDVFDLAIAVVVFCRHLERHRTGLTCPISSIMSSALLCLRQRTASIAHTCHLGSSQEQVLLVD